MSAAVRVSYLYDAPLPNRYAATIQILKTGRALAELGLPFTLAAGPLAEPPESVLASLALEPHPDLRLASLFPGPRPSGRLRGFRIARRLRRARLAEDGHVLISRGGTGFHLPRLLPPCGSRRSLFLYEMHRLLALGAAEARRGGKVGLGEELPADLAARERREAGTVAAADGLLFLTEGLRKAAEARFGLSRPSCVAPSGVSPIGPARTAERDTDLLFVGKIERRKGPHLALEALRRLPGRRLKLVGDGTWQAEARRLVAEWGIGDRVELVGRVPHARVAPLLSRARVGLCLLPRDVDHHSEEFTSPLKLLEMMAAGLPVVATDVPAVRAVCSHGVDALLAPPDSPDAIASAVRRLLEDAELAARLSRAARRRAEDFSWRARAQTIARFIDGLARPEGADGGGR